MKKKIAKLTCTFAVISAALFTLTGCSNPDPSGPSSAETSKPAVAYVISNTANSKPVDSSAPLIQDTMLDAAMNYGYSFIVRVDGDPALVSTEDLNIDEQYKTASKERLKRDAASKASNLLQIVDGVTPLNPEADYLEALRLGASSLRSLDSSYTSRTIICCGSGLSTSGYLNFQNNLLSAEPQVIVDMLKEREALPDLSGCTVYWLGMAKVEAPQEKLTPKQSNNLTSIWKAVVEASGGEFVSNDYIAVSDETRTTDSLPSVSVVDIPSDTPIVFDSDVLDETDTEESNAFDEPVALEESQVQFVGDEAAYLNPEAALETIRPIADYLAKHESVSLLLVGSTAGDITDESTLSLSQARADAVKKTLCDDLGIAESRIHTLGMGSSDHWHISNAGYDDGAAASSNRKVTLISADTELAQNLMNNH